MRDFHTTPSRPPDLTRPQCDTILCRKRTATSPCYPIFKNIRKLYICDSTQSCITQPRDTRLCRFVAPFYSNAGYQGLGTCPLQSRETEAAGLSAAILSKRKMPRAGYFSSKGRDASSKVRGIFCAIKAPKRLLFCAQLVHVRTAFFAGTVALYAGMELMASIRADPVHAPCVSARSGSLAHGRP